MRITLLCNIQLCLYFCTCYFLNSFLIFCRWPKHLTTSWQLWIISTRDTEQHINTHEYIYTPVSEVIHSRWKCTSLYTLEIICSRENCISLYKIESTSELCSTTQIKGFIHLDIIFFSYSIFILLHAPNASAHSSSILYFA